MVADRKQPFALAADIEASDQAEASLLGALILMDSREAIDRVSESIQPSSFRGYFPGHRMQDQPINARIFAGLLNCTPKLNEIAVATEMCRQGTWKAGDRAYILHLLAVLPSSPLDWPDFAEAVAYHAGKRGGKFLPRANNRRSFITG